MKDELLPLLQADIPTILWGQPGIGKTAAVVALAERNGAQLEVLACGALDTPDVVGYLVPHNGDLFQVPPPWAKRVRAALDAKRPVWVFFDEASCAPPAVQAALLRVIQEREVAGLSIKGCCVVAAANPADTAADGGWLSPAVAGRMAHLNIGTPDVGTWASGLLSQWGVGWPSSIAAKAAGSIAGFLQRNPSALFSLPEGESRGRAWPSPRSWHHATKALAAVLTGGGQIVSPIARAVVASCVGAPAADEWLTWMQASDLPDPEALLDGTAGWPIRGDQRIAVATALVAAALSGPDEGKKEARVKTAWARLNELRPEQALSAAKALSAGHWSMPEESDDLVARVKETQARMGIS